jgi:tetratricopeptide (TPR) repeat protein
MGFEMKKVEGIMCQSKIIRWVAMAAVCAVCAVAVPARAQTGGLEGTVTLQDGTLCNGCLVVIERLEMKGNYKVKTHKDGKYTYIGLPIGTYKITLQDTGGRMLFYFGNKRVGLGDPQTVDFDLPKELERTKQEQMANPEVQKKLEQQAKEQKEYTGLKELYDAASGLFDAKDYVGAAVNYEKALPLAKGKNRLVILERLADCYSKNKDRDKAIATYQEAIEGDPTNAGLHNNLGNVYADSGQTDKAKEEFQKAAEIDPPGAAQYYFNLGAVLYNVGKMDDSVEAFKKATTTDPKFANAYFWLGQALLGKATTGPNGEVVAAPGTKEALEAYLQIEPSGQNAPAAQALLQTIEGGVETQYSKKKKKN